MNSRCFRGDFDGIFGRAGIVIAAIRAEAIVMRAKPEAAITALFSIHEDTIGNRIEINCSGGHEPNIAKISSEDNWGQLRIFW